MDPEEVDAYLSEQRTCRVASVDRNGAPHVSALWFAWDGESLWLNSIVKSQRWTNIERDPRVSVLVDSGHDFGELKGVELLGSVEPVGEVPRTGEPVPELDEPERLFGQKYAGGAFAYDGRHAWLRVRPDKIVSWDFTKMSASR